MNASTITFGIEIEAIVPIALTRTLGMFNYSNAKTITAHPKFKVKTDGSVRTTKPQFTGVEFVSDVLVGQEGVNAVVAFVAWLNYHGVEINDTCGLHIHVGIIPNNEIGNRCLIRLFAQHERAMFASTGTKKRENNQYCQPVTEKYRSLAKSAKITDMDAAQDIRYRALNLRNITGGRRPTVEFRLFAPTLNAIKILGHIYTCVGLVEKAYQATRPPAYQRTKPPESGVASVERLMRCLHWSPRKGGFGVIDASYVLKIKKEFRRLAEKYDRR